MEIKKQLNYLPHVDGLRAIAVISVVIFHAFPAEGFAGFVGVDIFFVISGYLISGHIITAINDQNFRLYGFYVKRVRRLYPALLSILVSLLVLGWFVFSDTEFALLGKHLAASTIYLQNFNLASESGYFDLASEKKPLLHLWSLSIEEQFYIFWPILLMVIWRLRIKVMYFVSVITVIMAICSFSNPEITTRFYYPQYRVWELAVGALAWCIQARWLIFNETEPKNIKILKFHLSWVGGLFICMGFVLISEDDFPSFTVLLPVLGCALIIVAGAHTILNRLILSNSVMCSIGRVSYPLYLWHWPVFSIAYVLLGEKPDVALATGLILLSLLLSILTYKYVEIPLRYTKKHKKIERHLMSFMLLLGLVGYTVWKFDGFPERNANQIVVKRQGDIGHDEYHKYIDENNYVCRDKKVLAKALYWRGHVRCHQSKDSAKVDVVLLGDSHAEHLFLGVSKSMREKNVAYYILGGMPVSSNPGFSHIYESIAADKNISIVIIAGYWKQYFKTVNSQGVSLEQFEEQLSESIKRLILAKKKVFITNDLPDFNFEPENCKYARLIGASKCDADKTQYKEYLSVMELVFNKLNNEYPDLETIDSFSMLCTSSQCSMSSSDNKRLHFRDRNHLNLNGSDSIGIKVAEEVSLRL